MPTYYIMERNQGIAETMAAQRPSQAQIAACRWLTEEDLQGLQYRVHPYRVSRRLKLLPHLNGFSI